MWNLKMFMALMSALWLVACDDETKKNNDDDSATNGDGAVKLMFGTDLANFDHTKKPKDFKVSVHKGDAPDEESTLEITVEIACGTGTDAPKASHKVKAAEGVASFTISNFEGEGKINFAGLDKGTECTATATAAGATKGEKEFEVNDPDAPAAQPGITVDEHGRVTVSGGTVNIKLEDCGNEVFLISWANDGAVSVAGAAGLAHDAPGLFVVGDASAADCKLSSGALEQTTLADYEEGGAQLTVTGETLTVGGNTGETKVTIHTSAADPQSPTTKGVMYQESSKPTIAATNVVWVKDDNGVRRAVKTN